MPSTAKRKRSRRPGEAYPHDISEASFQSDIIQAAKLNGWRFDVEDAHGHHPRTHHYLGLFFRQVSKARDFLLGRRGGVFTLAYHTHDSRASQAGYPDLTLVHPRRGLIIFAELKTNTNYPSTEQRLWLAALSSATANCPNILVRLWKPKHWDDIIALLGGIDPTLL